MVWRTLVPSLRLSAVHGLVNSQALTLSCSLARARESVISIHRLSLFVGPYRGGLTAFGGPFAGMAFGLGNGLGLGALGGGAGGGYGAGAGRGGRGGY